MKTLLTGITLLVIITLVYFLQQHNYLPAQNNATLTSTIIPTQTTDESAPEKQTVTLDTTDNTPIVLEISQPIDGSTVTGDSVIVKGKTKAKATIFVNELEIKADANGEFAAPVDIYEGENTISILAHDDLGNYSEKELTINGPEH